MLWLVGVQWYTYSSWFGAYSHARNKLTVTLWQAVFQPAEEEEALTKKGEETVTDYTLGGFWELKNSPTPFFKLAELG